MRFATRFLNIGGPGLCCRCSYSLRPGRLEDRVPVGGEIFRTCPDRYSLLLPNFPRAAREHWRPIEDCDQLLECTFCSRQYQSRPVHQLFSKTFRSFLNPFGRMREESFRLSTTRANPFRYLLTGYGEWSIYVLIKQEP